MNIEEKLKISKYINAISGDDFLEIEKLIAKSAKDFFITPCPSLGFLSKSEYYVDLPNPYCDHIKHLTSDQSDIANIASLLFLYAFILRKPKAMKLLSLPFLKLEDTVIYDSDTEQSIYLFQYLIQTCQLGEFIRLSDQKSVKYPRPSIKVHSAFQHLHSDQQVKQIPTLLKCGFDINKPSWNNETPIMTAFHNKTPSFYFIKTMIENGARFDCQSIFNKTFIQILIKNERVDLIVYLTNEHFEPFLKLLKDNLDKPNNPLRLILERPNLLIKLTQKSNSFKNILNSFYDEIFQVVPRHQTRLLTALLMDLPPSFDINTIDESYFNALKNQNEADFRYYLYLHPRIVFKTVPGSNLNSLHYIVRHRLDSLFKISRTQLESQHLFDEVTNTLDPKGNNLVMQCAIAGDFELLGNFEYDYTKLLNSKNNNEQTVFNLLRPNSKDSFNAWRTRATPETLRYSILEVFHPLKTTDFVDDFIHCKGLAILLYQMGKKHGITCCIFGDFDEFRSLEQNLILLDQAANGTQVLMIEYTLGHSTALKVEKHDDNLQLIIMGPFGAAESTLDSVSNCIVNSQYSFKSNLIIGSSINNRMSSSGCKAMSWKDGRNMMRYANFYRHLVDNNYVKCILVSNKKNANITIFEFIEPPEFMQLVSSPNKLNSYFKKNPNVKLSAFTHGSKSYSTFHDFLFKARTIGDVSTPKLINNINVSNGAPKFILKNLSIEYFYEKYRQLILSMLKEYNPSELQKMVFSVYEFELRSGKFVAKAPFEESDRDSEPVGLTPHFNLLKANPKTIMSEALEAPRPNLQKLKAG